MSTIQFSDYTRRPQSSSSATQEPASSHENATTPFNAVQSHAVLASASPFQNTPPIGKEGFTAVPSQFQKGYGDRPAGDGTVNWRIQDTTTWSSSKFQSLYNKMGMDDTSDIATTQNAMLARKYEMDPTMGSSVYQDSARARLHDTQLYINEENNFNIIATLSISTLILAAIMLGSGSTSTIS